MLTPNECVALSGITRVNPLKIKPKYLGIINVGERRYNYPPTIKRSRFFLLKFRSNLHNLLLFTNVLSYATNPLNPP